MVRLLVLVFGLAIVAFTVKFALDRTAGSDPAATSQPKRQLDSVRERAKELEGELRRKADRGDLPADK